MSQYLTVIAGILITIEKKPEPEVLSLTAIRAFSNRCIVRSDRAA